MLCPTVAFEITFPNTPGQTPGLPCLARVGRPTDGPDPIEVPEPASLILFGAGLVGLGALNRRRRRA